MRDQSYLPSGLAQNVPDEDGWISPPIFPVSCACGGKDGNRQAHFRNLLLVAWLNASLRVTADQSKLNPFALYREAAATLEVAQAFSVHVEKQRDLLFPAVVGLVAR